MLLKVALNNISQTKPIICFCFVTVFSGIDINGSTQFGRTALHAAASKDNFIILKYLIDHGAKIYSTDLLGKSPLDTAKSFSSYMCEKNLKVLIVAVSFIGRGVPDENHRPVTSH
jgi:hypothetical protein